VVIRNHAAEEFTLRAVRQAAVAPHELIEVPKVIRLQYDGHRRRALVESPPYLGRLSWGLERIQDEPHAPRLDPR